jgi:DNA-binding transcriptional regulator YiaG
MKELKAFKRRRGHCCVPYNYPLNPPLGRWVTNIRQKKKHGTLAEEKVHMLEALGFCWERQSAEEPTNGVRFSARSVKAQRKRLGLSAEKYAKLVGVSSLTIYSWESGKTKPRKAQFDALVAVRGIGKREAMQRLEEMKKGRGKKR